MSKLNVTTKYIINNFYLFYPSGVLRRFKHCTGQITMGSWKGRGNQYIQFIRVLYCKLQTNGKQQPAFPLEAVPGTRPRPQRWEVRVLPLCHRGPLHNKQGRRGFSVYKCKPQSHQKHKLCTEAVIHYSTQAIIA